MAPTPIYVTAPERTGFAIVAGAALGGLGWAIGGLAGGTRDGLDLTGFFIAGTIATALVITALGLPAWWLARRRGPVAAGIVGGLVSGLVVLSAQTFGFGFAMPAQDGWTLSARWLSAAAVSGVAAFLGAIVALAMWLVAYRRL